MNLFLIGFLGGTFAIMLWNVVAYWVRRLEGAWVSRNTVAQASPSGTGAGVGDSHAPSLPYPWIQAQYPPGVYGHTDQELANEESPEARDEKRFRGPGY